MEIQKFMKSLPIGFRFHPTDEELIVHYLRRKALSVPLPASVIPEFNVFETYPWNLPGSGSSEDLREKMYFFSKSNQSGNRCIRVLTGGYWKPIGKRKQVVGSGSNQPVGFKRILIFYQGKSRTNWTIYEFRLLGLLQKVLLKDWVVYKVFQKKRKPSNNKKRNFMVEHNSDMGVSQTTTDITELSSTTEEDEEEEEEEDDEEETSLVFLP